jgi:hypothetical protein
MLKTLGDVNKLKKRILNSKMNTMLLLRANWCIHCNMFESNWLTIIKDMTMGKNKHADLQFISIEADDLRVIQQHDPAFFKYITTTPSSKEMYFPKLMLLAKKKKTPKSSSTTAHIRYVFHGERSVDEVKSFIVKKI